MKNMLSKFKLHPFIFLRTPLNSLQKAYCFPEVFHEGFLAGIYVSSPELWNEMNSDQATTKKLNKKKLALAKYWIRSCSRSTPFATFAGGAVVNLTKDISNIEIGNISDHHIRTRLDMDFVVSLVQKVALMPDIIKQVKYFKNNSIYEIPDGFRYVEYKYVGNVRKYDLISIEKTRYLEEIMKCVENGATFDQLRCLLVNLENVSDEEATNYLTELIKSQLLSSELEATITGHDPFSTFVKQLGQFDEVQELVSIVESINSKLSEGTNSLNSLMEIEKELSSINIPTSNTKIKFQTDLFVSLKSNNLESGVCETIHSQLDELSAMSTRYFDPSFEEFKSKFQSRYDLAEVPLSVALDGDLGIGYVGGYAESSAAGDLIDDLPSEARKNDSANQRDFHQQLSLEKYLEFNKTGGSVIVITEDDINKYKPSSTDISFPDSVYVKGQLVKANNLIFDKDNFLFHPENFGGPSAANLLGRFAYGDQNIQTAIGQIVQKEEQNDIDAIYAEIVHLPQDKIGNVILRPILRQYEIPYVGNSGLDADHQIKIDDLLLSISNGEFVVRSKSLKKRIIPRLSTAHNFHQPSLPIYRFLCDLQIQSVAQLRLWNWGVLGDCKYLPRVEYKNIILARAQWNISEADLKNLKGDFSSDRFIIDEFRVKYNIPHRVIISNGDNDLLVDFDTEVGVQLIFHYLKRQKSLLLKEFLPTTENCIVHDKNGEPFSSEIVISFYNNEYAHSRRNIPKLIDPYVKRNFSPLSEWLYFKIYCGPKTAENTLKNLILPFIETKKDLFEKFFFIRYKEEFNQIRIRFYNTDVRIQLNLYESFLIAMQPAMENLSIERIIVDTYMREIERYGENLIEEAENLFYNDSFCVLNFIKMLDGEEGEKYRFIFALRGIDKFLDDFGYDLDRKIELLGIMQSSHFMLFGGSNYLRQKLNDKYRFYQKDIISHMDSTMDAKNEIQEAVDVFEQRSMANKPVVEIIHKKIDSSEAGKKLNDLLPSYVHMYMNRLFIANQRKYELVTYHFLERYYLSLKARQRKVNNIKGTVSI